MQGNARTCSRGSGNCSQEILERSLPCKIQSNPSFESKKIEGSKYAVDRRGTEGCVALVALLGLFDLLVVFFEFG